MMAFLVRGLCWILFGVVFSIFHLFLLRRALTQVIDRDPAVAGRRMARGFLLRLVLLAPFLFLVARQGLVASGGLILGSLLGRWFLFIWA